MTTMPPAAPRLDGTEESEPAVVQPYSMQHAAAPVASAAAAKVGFAAALFVIGVGVIAVRDAVVAVGWIAGRAWLPMALASLDGLTPAAWITAAAIGVGVLGLLCVAAALAPRRTTAVPLVAESAVYLHRADVAAVATAAAREVPGVLSAGSRATRRKVVIKCRVTSMDGEIRHRIAAAVDAEFVALQQFPKVVVRAKEVR